MLSFFFEFAHGVPLTVNVKSVRIGDVVMPVYPPQNAELVPEYDGPLYEHSQVEKKELNDLCFMHLALNMRLSIL